MSEEEVIASLDRMFQEIRYTPSRAYGDMTKKEPSRAYDARVAALKAAHPSLSEMECEKLILRVWLDLSMDYDDEPFSYATYMALQDYWLELMVSATTTKLRDVLAVFSESLITT